MKEIAFLANPCSPHVRQWVEFLCDDYEITIFHVLHGGEALVHPDDAELICPFPAFFKLFPASLQYVLLGIYLRFLERKKYLFFHAHNTSGYGLSALFSGRWYGVTTYSSEIFSMRERSAIHRFFIKLILKRARFVTSTSQAMVDALAPIMGSGICKVVCFSFGVSSSFLGLSTAKHPMRAKRWFVNRRIHPLYQTLEVVRAFKVYLEEGGGGELILLEGDADLKYLAIVKEEIAECPEIRCIEGFISKEDMICELDAASFCISMPVSDQLSNAILEGAARGVIPVLRRLESYKDFESIAIWVKSEACQSDIVDMFKYTASLDDAFLSRRSEECMRFVSEFFSSDEAKKIYLRLVNECL